MFILLLCLKTLFNYQVLAKRDYYAVTMIESNGSIEYLDYSLNRNYELLKIVLSGDGFKKLKTKQKKWLKKRNKIRSAEEMQDFYTKRISELEEILGQFKTEIDESDSDLGALKIVASSSKFFSHMNLLNMSDFAKRFDQCMAELLCSPQSLHDKYINKNCCFDYLKNRLDDVSEKNQDSPLVNYNEELDKIKNNFKQAVEQLHDYYKKSNKLSGYANNAEQVLLNYIIKVSAPGNN